MPELTSRMEVNLNLSGHIWIPHFEMRGRQSFVIRGRVEKFKREYLANNPIPPPTAYFDKRLGLYVIDNGHKRSIALYQLHHEGILEVGEGNHYQRLIGGFIVKEIILSPFTIPTKNVFTLDRIKVNPD